MDPCLLILVSVIRLHHLSPVQSCCVSASIILRLPEDQLRLEFPIAVVKSFLLPRTVLRSRSLVRRELIASSENLSQVTSLVCVPSNEIDIAERKTSQVLSSA